jgi:hypothetical protein
VIGFGARLGLSGGNESTAARAVLLASTSVALAGNDWKNSPLHHWFDGLASKRGVCCSYADGGTLTDVEWDMKDSHYRVFLEDR